ncbi:Ig-like domain-containing protein, partial [Solirubrobacter phytolaccae]
IAAARLADTARVAPPASAAPDVPTARLAAPVRPRLSGTAKDTGCGGKLRRVEVSLQRKSGKRCQTVGTAGKPGKRRACSKRTWLRAKGTTRWSLTLKRKLPAGTYALRVRARDAAGNLSSTRTKTLKVR